MFQYKSLISIVVVALLAGCGSFKKVVDSNQAKKSEHMQFQVNRLGLVDKCYTRAATDNQFSTCAMLQMQIQTEMGFTVTSEANALPETPEKMIKDTTLGLGKLAVGAKLGEKLIDSLNRPNDVITQEVPEYIEPTIIKVPEGSEILE